MVKNCYQIGAVEKWNFVERTELATPQVDIAEEMEPMY